MKLTSVAVVLSALRKHMHRHTTCVLALAILPFISTSSLAEQMSYGSRAGMTVTVLAKTGIGTEDAVITVEHLPDDARAYCVEYVLDNSKECVSRTMANVVVEPQVFANCETKTWTDFGGERFALLGEKTPPDPYARFDIKRISTGEVLDSSVMASGYGTALGIFQILCPGVTEGAAAEEEDNGLDQALTEFARVPLATFTCLIGDHQLMGMPNINNSASTQRYEFQVLDDATLRSNGVTVPFIHREPAGTGPFSGVAYDVRQIMGGGSNGLQLPSTFTQEENDALNAGIVGMLGQAFGGRQRVLIINIETDAVALADIPTSGPLANVVMPECYRSQ